MPGASKSGGKRGQHHWVPDRPITYGKTFKAGFHNRFPKQGIYLMHRNKHKETDKMEDKETYCK